MLAELLSDGLAVVAAFVNAASSTLQRKANISEPDAKAFSPGLVLTLARNRTWLAGIGCVIAGFLLQAGALARGELAVVQPILALELPFTLALASRVFRRRLDRRDWLAAALMTLGLVLVIGSLRPYGGSATTTSGLRWALGSGVTLAAVAALVAVAVRRRGIARAALLGVATGAVFGLTAAFMTGMSESFGGGLAATLSQWQTWAMIASGMAAMWLLQNALQAGTLVVVQPGLTLVDPLVSAIWGVAVFGERVHTGPSLIAAIAGACLMIAGTRIIAGSRLLQLAR